MKATSGWIFSALIAVGGTGLICAVFLHGDSGKKRSLVTVPPVAQTAAVDLSAGLRDTAQKFLTVIEKGQPLDLLNFWSASGVVLGVDFEDHPVSKSVFREQVRKKEGLYCSFFDSACLTELRKASRRKANKGPATNPDYSYRDLLSSARTKTVRVSARREGETLTGYVTVRIENGEMTKSNTSTQLDFTFVSEAGSWKLAEIPSY